MHLRFSAFSAIAVSAVLVLTSCSSGSEPGAVPSASTVTVTTGPPEPTPAPPGPVAMTPVIGSVIAPPMPVTGTDGKTHLAYELVLTNTTEQIVTLTSLTAVSKGRTLLDLSAEGLAHWTRVIGNATTPTTTIGPGQTALVWLDLTVDDATGVPGDLSHTITVSLPQPQPPVTESTMSETIAPTVVDNRKPVTIAPPLTGDNWVSANGCCDMSPHRMAVSPLNGQLWAPERYAIDFVQLSADGRMSNGDKADLVSYPFFGADVHGVADGQVVSVIDSLPEQIPGANPVGLPLEQYPGNRVVQDIGGGNYVMYAHLKTGSIRVKVGDKITTGQIVGSVGNTGNTDTPHLHFQLMNTPDPLRANGLPFVFDKFRLDSRAIGIDTASDTPVEMQHGVSAGDQTYRMPLTLDVMSYPAR